MRIRITSPYSKAIGNKRTLKEVRNIVLKFIDLVRRDTVVQRYVKFVGVCDQLDRIKITKTDGNGICSALRQVTVIESFAIAYPVSLDITNKHGYKNEVDIGRL